MPEIVSSFANPAVKRVRALAQRKYRRRESAFVVEGLQPVWRAVASSWPIDTLMVAPELLTNAAAAQMVAEQARAGVRIVEVNREVFAHVSDRDGPSGLLAIVSGTVRSLAEFRPAHGRPIVALHDAGNPGNIGTVLRSVDAAGGGGLVLIGQTADPLAPSSVKASMGSLFAVPMAHAESADELLRWASSSQRSVVAVTGGTDETLWEAKIPTDCVLLMGSEGAGLPGGLARQCAASVAIPMEGTAESLNLATATSIALFDLKRRRDTDKAAQV